MQYQPVDLIGAFYADDSLLWSSQDCVNWLPTVAQQKGTRTEAKLATPPGLSYFTQCGEGPIRGARDVEGKLFVVSGNELYEVAFDGTPTLRGAIPGVGLVSMSHNKRGYGNQLLIVNGDAGYVWDTSLATLTKITDSGYPGAVMADYLDHYMIQVEPFGRFWFHSNLDNALDYNTLDQYDAEASPDKVVGIAANQLEAVVFSQKTTEFFSNTGATTGTFQSKRIVIERGCASRFTIIKLDNTVMWLGNDGIFYRLNGYGAQPISTGPIHKAIAGLDWANAFGFTWEDKGYKVAYWTFPDGYTFGYDVTQPPGFQWHRRASFGINRWRLNTATYWQRRWIGGDYRHGLLYLIDWDEQHEVGQPMVSERTGGTANANQNAVICPYVEFLFDTGGPSWDGESGTIPPPEITGDVPDGAVGDSGTLQYVVTGGVPPYGQITVLSGSLPPGATMDTDGLVTYDYTTAGSYSWEVGGEDAQGTPFSVPDTAEVTIPSLFAAVDNQLTLLESTDGGASFPATVATGLVTATSEVCVQAAGGRLFHFGTTTEGRTSTDGVNFVACTGLTAPAGIVPGSGNLIKIGTEWQLYHFDLHVSTDGVAFSQRTLAGGGVSRPVVDGTKVLAIWGGRFLQVSTDSGVNFTSYSADGSINTSEGVQRLLCIPGVKFVAFARDGSGNLYIGTSATGLSGSWTFGAGPATPVCHGVSRDPTTGRVVMVLQTGATWYSDDDCVTWSAGAAVPYTGALSFPSLPANNMIFANGAFFFCARQTAGVNRIYSSPDGVTAWAQVYSRSDSNAVESIAEFAP